MSLTKILCADFGEFSGKLLSHKLTSMNFSVDYVNNGEAVLESCATTDYVLIFISVELPKINGYEVAEEIRKYDKNLPIIVYSSYDRVNINMSNFTDYLHKPFKDLELDDLIGKYVSF